MHVSSIVSPPPLLLFLSCGYLLGFRLKFFGLLLSLSNFVFDHHRRQSKQLIDLLLKMEIKFRVVAKKGTSCVYMLQSLDA